jgi:hypothetical protein
MKSPNIMHACAWFDRPLLVQCVDSLLALPPGLRPTRFSEGERFRDPANVLSDKARFQAFVERNRHGFCLRAPECVFDLSERGDGWFTLACFAKKLRREVGDVLVHIGRLGAVFGYACLMNEYYSRHRVVVTIEEATVEQVVGTDPSRYVLGLYWTTFLSSGLLAKHGLSLQTLRAPGVEVTNCGKRRHALRFFPEPDQWEDWRGVMDRLIESGKSIFDIEKVRHAVERAKTLEQVTRALDLWP